MKTSLLSAIATAISLLSVGVMAQSMSSAAAPVDPTAFINQFESTFGKFEGYRRSGAKGICATGEFMGTAAARGLSAASVFSGANVPVVVRFSVGGANPKVADIGVADCQSVHLSLSRCGRYAPFLDRHRTSCSGGCRGCGEYFLQSSRLHNGIRTRRYLDCPNPGCRSG